MYVFANELHVFVVCFHRFSLLFWQYINCRWMPELVWWCLCRTASKHQKGVFLSFLDAVNICVIINHYTGWPKKLDLLDGCVLWPTPTKWYAQYYRLVMSSKESSGGLEGTLSSEVPPSDPYMAHGSIKRWEGKHKCFFFPLREYNPSIPYTHTPGLSPCLLVSLVGVRGGWGC